MNVAILGWGSLIWDERPNFDKWHEKWLCDGPVLKLEFSRISKSRACALTLVIDETNGELCRVAYAMSKRQNPDDAICDLRCREDSVLGSIGYFFANGSRSGKPAIPDRIRAWANEKKIGVVVWTGLTSNFQVKVGKPFSIPEAVSYLKTLSPERVENRN